MCQQYVKYINIIIIYLILIQGPILKCLSALKCVMEMLIFVQGIPTIKAEEDQYTFIMLNRDRIKSTVPLHTEEHLVTTGKH